MEKIFLDGNPELNLPGIYKQINLADLLMI
jgi:hypothetical protein